MPTNNTSIAHVTLSIAELAEVCGGQQIGFPAGQIGTAAGEGIKETVKQWPNIQNTLNDAHRWGHENGWAAINSVRDGFAGKNGTGTEGMSIPQGVP